MPASGYRIQEDVSPLKDHVLVVNMEQGERTTAGGIILRDDNGKDHGIRPRWAQVYKVGSNVNYLEPGQWILVEHGRWTYGIVVELPEAEGDDFYLQRVDVEGILAVSDEKPTA